MNNIKEPLSPLVSIIIRTKNEERWIDHCLSAIATQSIKDYEIVLVDNNSDDKSVTIAKKYTEKIKKVNIIQHEGNQADLIDYIISGKIDLAVTYNLSLPKNISFIPLINVPPHVLVNANHKFSKLKEIDLNDIKDEPLILLDLPLSREYFLSIFEAQNIKPKISEKTSQISVLRSLVAHNFGYSLANLQLGIPQSIDGLKISQIPLKGEHQSLELGLAIADLNYIPSLTNEFIEFAKTIYKEDNLHEYKQ